MLKSYEAVFDHGTIRWLDTPPSVGEARLIITVLPDKSPEAPPSPRHSSGWNDDTDVSAQAESLGSNLSRTLEARRTGKQVEQPGNAWKEENKEAIMEYNNRIRAEGLFGDTARLF
ncbi:MAG: type II toxin-antitoxin system CcdA family antitoxin [Magnetococcales bacterium]|nr:type II toxin-antitoxin system CcdA family antitoxin [Magnetococcales bacterium]